MKKTGTETELYGPVKAFLEAQGYLVKAEIGAADVVALRGTEPPVIIELKLSLSLSLFHQALERLAVTDDVYIAVEHRSGKRFALALKKSIRLARHIGAGVMSIRLSDGLVQVHCDPAPYRPRKSAKRHGILLREFARRSGDPNIGGQGRQGLVTAYRQDARKVALYLHEAGACRGVKVARETGVEKATRIMRDNHYGWFERVATGIYGLTPEGAQAVSRAEVVLGK